MPHSGLGGVMGHRAAPRCGAQVVRDLAPAFQSASRTATAAADAAKAGGAGGALGLSVVAWLGQEGGGLLEFVRSTLYKCVKAAQAVVKGVVALCLAVNRHRVSLMMQLKRWEEEGGRRGGGRP